MNTGKMMAIAVMALLSIPLMAQQPDGTAAQSNPAGAEAQGTETVASAIAPAEMRPVNGELVGKLDSKSAKAGDSVVVKTTGSFKTAEGTEIPKGSKLVGQVTAVKAHSDDNANGELAVRFDHAELKGGQSVAIQGVIESVAPSASDAANNPANNAPVVMGTPMGGASGSTGMGSGGMGSGGGGSMAGSRASAPVSNGAADQSVNGMGAGQGSATGNNPSAGQVVGKIGGQPIRTTAIPGVLLASNTPSEAAKFSGVFVAAKSDVHLSGGTQVVLEVSAPTAQ